MLRELHSIADSPYFCNSKRYPALLRYIVENALAGKSELLKERALGIDVFDRPATYDTNADTVVRFTAGEVRSVSSCTIRIIPLPASGYRCLRVPTSLSFLLEPEPPENHQTAVPLEILPVSNLERAEPEVSSPQETLQDPQAVPPASPWRIPDGVSSELPGLPPAKGARRVRPVCIPRALSSPDPCPGSACHSVVAPFPGSSAQ